MEEIYKSSGSWPNFASKLRSIGIFHEHASSMALIISSTIVDLNAGIDDRNVMIFSSDVSHTIQWEPRCVNSEIFIVDHVVNIAPNGIKRKVI